MQLQTSTHIHLLDILAIVSILGIIFVACLPVVFSGQQVNLNNDFFQYASRHEQVRQGLLKYHTLPQRTHFFGGGFPTIGDPEDPTFNPLIFLTLCLGAVTGIKWIGVLSMMFGAVSLYFLCRQALAYSRWGALASALFFGLSLWLPVRMRDGNPNEVYYHFIPACLFCLFAAPRNKRYLLFLAALFMTMLSDGKLTFFASIMYIGFLCAFHLIPGFWLWSIPHSSSKHSKISNWLKRFQPLKWLLVALVMTFILDLFRILPAIELIQTKGSLSRMDLYFHGKNYAPEAISAYSLSQLWREAVAWKGGAGLKKLSSVCIGWTPLILAFVACLLNWRKAMPWLIGLLLFMWLAMAHQAPFGLDLFRYLWKLPILNAIGNPAKYFGCLPVLSVCVLAGQSFDGLKKLPLTWGQRGRRLQDLTAFLLIGSGVWFLYPKVQEVSRISYSYTIPKESLEKSGEFYQVHGQNLDRSRSLPLEANTYVNLLRGLGTIDWYTGIPIDEKAMPRYFVNPQGQYLPNPAYRGECFWLESGESGSGKPEKATAGKFKISPGKFKISPHFIVAEVSSKEGGTLIINQNYHADWRLNKGNKGILRSWEGLLAVQLPPGEHQLRLRYFSRSFAIGLLFSFLGFIGIGVWAIYRMFCWKAGVFRRMK